MRHFISPASCLLALTINSPAVGATTNVTLATTGAPAGFTELASAKVTLVDVYFGERKVGETLAVTKPGRLQFRSPREVLGMLPDVNAAPEVASTLAAEMPANTQLACSLSVTTGCGLLEPDVAGIIFDEEKFRVSIFVNPKFLRTVHVVPQGYLPAPDGSLSLTNAFGLTASGTVDGLPIYNVQNRTIVGLGSARLRTNTSVASDFGLVVDDLVGELDRKDMRYSAGLFWTPGNEFIGQRRVLGAGFRTQFDTSVQQESLQGTPLIVFLAQPARVELLVDGRLVDSRAYDAGNIEIETGALPDGSYPVVLRIRLSNGSVREERRFFVRSSQLPPVGRVTFHGFAGLLANTRRYHPISLSKDFYYQTGAAWRLSNQLALDGGVFGTEHKAIVEAGGSLITGPLRVRAAGLVSSGGDKGGLLQLTTAAGGPLSISVDLRRIYSSDGRPLIPLPSYVQSFGQPVPIASQIANGSYTQATGSVGLHVGDAYFQAVGSYRRDRDLRADYSIGPSINWPIVSRSQLQVVLEASAQRTRTSTAGFAGLRMFLSAGGMSMQSTAGGSIQSTRDSSGPSIARTVSSFSGQFAHETDGGTQFNVESGFDRNIDTSTAHTGGTLYSRLGNLRADLRHNFEGNGGTQYDLSFQSGFALGAGATAWGARNVEQSAILIAVKGDAVGTSFDVLVDEVVRGRARVGQDLSLFVPSYRSYAVRLVPTNASAVSYDTAARQVTVYPGNVKSLEWRADPTFIIFARAVSPDGNPIANALVQTAKAVAETDSNGYFQIDLLHGDRISITKDHTPPCQIAVGPLAVKNDFASLGKVVCQ